MEITKEVMIQYETIRRSGMTNMFNYFNVIQIAKKNKLKELASFSMDDYKELLMNFSKLMEKFGIKQN